MCEKSDLAADGVTIGTSNHWINTNTQVRVNTRSHITLNNVIIIVSRGATSQCHHYEVPLKLSQHPRLQFTTIFPLMPLRDPFKRRYITSLELCHCYSFKESFPSEVLACICACQTFKNSLYLWLIATCSCNRMIYVAMVPQDLVKYMCVMYTWVSVLSLITLCSHSVKSLSLCRDKILIMQATKLK